MNDRIWRGVPLGEIEKWQAAFCAGSDSYYVPGACPVCGEHALMRYYYLGRSDHREIRGITYKGVGSLWEWCSSCKVYSHAQAYVPEAWVGPELMLDHRKLTPIPDVIDDLIKAVRRND